MIGSSARSPHFSHDHSEDDDDSINLHPAVIVSEPAKNPPVDIGAPAAVPIGPSYVTDSSRHSSDDGANGGVSAAINFTDDSADQTERRKVLLEQQSRAAGSVISGSNAPLSDKEGPSGFSCAQYFSFVFLLLLPLLPCLAMVSLSSVFVRLLQPAADATLGYCRSRKILYYPFFAMFTTVLYLAGIFDSVVDIAVIIVMINDARSVRAVPGTGDLVGIYDLVRFFVVAQCVILGMVGFASMIQNEKRSFMQTAFAAILRGGTPSLVLSAMTWRFWLVPVRLHMISYSWRGEHVQKKAENRVTIWCYNALTIVDSIFVSLPIAIFSFIDLFRALKVTGFVFVQEKHLWLVMKLVTGSLGAIQSAYFASRSPDINRPLSTF